MDRTEIDHNGRLKSTPGPFGIERGLARSRRLEVESSTIPPDQDERMSDLQEDSDRKLTDPETWVDLHGDFLFRFALARVGNREVAEDLVQDTFVAAVRSKDFDARSNERTWFVGILKHKIIDHLRRRGRERPISSLLDDRSTSESIYDDRGVWRSRPGSWPEDPQIVLEEKEFWQTFRNCLDKLPMRFRSVYSLWELENMPTSDVCTELGISPANLRGILYKTRMNIRRCLETNWFGSTEEGEAGR